MFYYQAGDRYKLTLSMVAVAGLMAGVFFTLLLGGGAPSEPPRRARTKQNPYNPDTGAAAVGGRGSSMVTGPGGDPNAATTPQVSDAQAAQDFVRNFVTYSFNMNSNAASASQAQAMAMMDSETAKAYRNNVWTPDLEQLVTTSNLTSQFNITSISSGQQNPDGSIVIFMNGTQILNSPASGQQQKPVSVEYLVQRGPSGWHIIGIQEKGQ